MLFGIWMIFKVVKRFAVLVWLVAAVAVIGLAAHFFYWEHIPESVVEKHEWIEWVHEHLPRKGADNDSETETT